MKFLPSYKKTYSLSVLLILLFLGGEVYLEIMNYLQPCLLTYLERIIFLVLGIVFFIARAHSQTPFTKKLANISIIFISLLGVFTAGRHVFLQHYPTTAFGSAAVGVYPELIRIGKLIGEAYLGTAQCSVINVSFWDISLETWALILFVLFTIIGFWQQHRETFTE
ncbi:MAG: disulfide bond formation protein B [Pseudomonadota bacterium]|nr:disulfide bond formation protein B [Gammaproteobacteria bacterium]MBU1926985.1 disulfide bond formation protein B [Gammaproteobacteria bacterium]MBU2546122.1 disulfide bond formation protein B [Gammaproteobacteria bacterium]